MMTIVNTRIQCNWQLLTAEPKNSQNKEKILFFVFLGDNDINKLLW